jgi:hypothetical protein
MRTSRTMITAAHEGIVASQPNAENKANPATTIAISAIGARTT